MRKAVITSGGTGGHIFPAVAVARKLIKEKGYEVLFIGTADGMEKLIIEKEGIRFLAVSSGRLYRKLTFKNFISAYLVIKGSIQSVRALKTEKPDVVVGFGGFVCAPVMLAAGFLGIKSVLQEQNAVPGLANRWLSKFAEKVLMGFEGAAPYFGKKAVFTGNPVREEIGRKSKAEGLGNLGLAVGMKTVSVIGGSQGGKGLNKAVFEALPFLKGKNIRVIWMTGKTEYEFYSKNAKGTGTDCLVKEFFSNIDDVYAASDLIVCRSGASTVFEVLKCGLPSVMVPFPYAANNHQYLNALDVEKHGAGLVCEEKDLSGEKLAGTIFGMFAAEGRLEKMGAAAKELGRRDGCESIVKEITGLI